MRKGKKLLSACLAAVMTVSLAACGGGNSGQKTTEGTAAAETESGGASAESTASGEEGLTKDNITLTMSWWGNDTRHEATQKAIEKFMEKYPNIKVDSTFGGWDGWESKMGLAFSQGNAEDIVQMGSFWHIDFNKDGNTFYDLNKVSQYLDLTQFGDLSSYEADGKLPCIPASMTARTMFWNKSTFEKAGIDIPKTWDDFIASGEIFKEKLGDDYYPAMMTNLDRIIFMVYYLESQYGKEWVTGNQCNYTEAEIQEGFDMLKMLEDKHVMPTMQEITDNAADPVQNSPVYIDGKWAGVYTWNTSPAALRSALPNPDDLVAAPMFEGFPHKGGMYKASLTFAITQTCEHPNEAAALINFLLNDPEGVALMGSERGVPLSKAGLEALEAADGVDPLIGDATKYALESNTFPMDKYFESGEYKAKTEGLYDRVFNAYEFGEIDSAEAAKQLLDGMNAHMAQ